MIPLREMIKVFLSAISKFQYPEAIILGQSLMLLIALYVMWEVDVTLSMTIN